MYGSDESDPDDSADSPGGDFNNSLPPSRSTGTDLRADEPGALPSTTSSLLNGDGVLGLSISDSAVVRSSSSGGGGVKSRQRGMRGLSFEALLDDLVVLSFFVSARRNEWK